MIHKCIAQNFLKKIGTWGWLDSEGFGDAFFKTVCGQTYTQARVCRYLMGLITGYDPDNMDAVS